MKPELVSGTAGASGERASWRRRVVYGAAVAVVATIGYRTVQWVTAGQAVTRSDCWAWRQVPFSEGWLVPYCSMFAIMALPWFWLPAEQLRRFAATVIGMAAVAWTIFLVYPTACGRPDVGTEDRLYGLLVVLDGPNNCLPCLHAALPVVAAWALAGSGGWWRGAGARWLLVAWVGLIAVAILGVRQHTGIDVVTGLMLGGVASLTWRKVRRKTANKSAAP